MRPISKIVSLNKNLSTDFINHIQNTKNVCLYKLGSHNIPENIFFPNAKSLTLINCSNYGIQTIVDPRFFPNINTINYLSMSPKSNTIHTRFGSNTKWIFPDKNYEYYNFMVETGYGRKDPELLKRYINNKKIIDGKNGFDISFELDLNIPEFGIVSGNWWQSQFYEYLVMKQTSNKFKDCMYPGENIFNISEIKQEIEEERLEKERVELELHMNSFEDMIDEDIKKD